MWNAIVELWNTVVFEPFLSLIALLIAVIPGHNLGIAIIVFVIIIKLIFYRLNKRQMMQMQQQRELQPEVDKIKKAHKGNRQQEALAIMALYKERGFKPAFLFLYLLVQLPIFIGLYQVARQIAVDPNVLIEKSYSFLHNLPWLKDLSNDISIFDSTFLGVVDLTLPAISTADSGGTVFYYAAFLVVLAAVAMQFLTAKQTIAKTAALSGPPRRIRDILAEHKEGKELDQQELMRAYSRLFVYIIPIITFSVFIGWVAILPFYWFFYNVLQFFQQKLFDSQNTVAKTKVSVNGKEEKGVLEKPLNAKQKKEQRQQSASGPRRKRVQSTAKTVQRSKKKGSR